jgi:hypothetical protein
MAMFEGKSISMEDGELTGMDNRKKYFEFALFSVSDLWHSLFRHSQKFFVYPFQQIRLAHGMR